MQNAATGTLTVPSLEVETLGDYACIIVDDIHVPQTKRVHVEETKEIYFVGGKDTRVRNFMLGDDVVLECPVRGNTTNVTFAWFRGNIVLVEEGRVSVTALDGGGTALRIMSAQLSDKSLYFCQLQKPDGKREELPFDVTIVSE